MSAAVQSPAGWQSGFLAVLPAVKTHAKIQFRHLPLEHREDAIQEAIAAACQSYRLLAVQGRLHVASPATIATYAVRHVLNGRHVGGHQDAAKDPLSPRCQRRHRVRVQSLTARPAGAGRDGWKRLVIADRKADIPALAALRVDFADWLATLNPKDQRIVNRLAAGDRTMQVADRFRLSWGRVSQLRRRYERQWLAFQGEGPVGQQVA
jgi:hypothetical protein